jgi:hypothetical protein
MAKHASIAMQIINGDEGKIGNIVAALIREHIPFDLSYAPSGVVVIAVENSDEAELRRIILTTT